MKLKSIREESKADLEEFKEIQKKRFDEALAVKKKEIEESDASNPNKDADELAAIEADFQENKAEVIDMLISNVLNVDISIPRVVKGNFEDEEEKEG